MVDDVALVTPPRRVSFRQRILSAALWSLAGSGLGQVIRFATNLLLTRLLVPNTFGVMAIATIIMIGLQLFSDLGLKQSIVQSARGDRPEFLNTAWAVQILRGFLLSALGLTAALLVFAANRFGFAPHGSVYADIRLPYVIAALSSTAMISGFGSTKLYEAGRNLVMARVTLIDLGTQLTNVVCILTWMFFDRTIWALVAGSIFSTLVNAILTHAWLPGTANSWRWDRPSLREIVGFGKWIFFSSILGFMVGNGDRLLLGGLIDSNSLGVYVIAFGMFSAAEQLLSRIITTVTFPALSEIVRERPAELKNTYYRMHSVVATVAYFCSGVLILAGHALIEVLYDARYLQAGWMLQILAIALLTVPFQVSVQCFLAMGMPHVLSSTTAVRLASLLVSVPIGFFLLGLPGSLWGIVLSYFSNLPLLIYYRSKFDLFDTHRELLPLPVTLFGMAVAKLVLMAIGH